MSGDAVKAQKGLWTELHWQIPALDNACINEIGFRFTMLGEGGKAPLDCLVDDLCARGAADYSLSGEGFSEEIWSPLRREIAQFTRHKGLLFLEDGALQLSCVDSGEAYTGHHAWRDYEAVFSLKPITEGAHFALVRVQGARRCYAAGFFEAGRIALMKKERGAFRKLADAPFDRTPGAACELRVRARGACLTLSADGQEILRVTDDAPYLEGGIGFGVRDGGHLQCERLEVRPLDA